MWFSLLVLIPLTAVLVQASAGGWSAYWDALTSPQTLAALRLTVGQAVLVTAVNVFMGTAIAWVLVRDQFPGKQLLEVVIDIPVRAADDRCRVWCCSACTGRRARSASTGPTRGSRYSWLSLFVTLPFIVRTVQPVLLELEHEVEEAAASLGANSVDDLPARDPP